MYLIVFNSFTPKSLCLLYPLIMHGHFAVAEPKFLEGLEYYRYPIAIFILYCWRCCGHVQSVKFHSGCLRRFRSGSSKKDQRCCGAINCQGLLRILAYHSLQLIFFSMSQTHSMTPRKCYRATVLLENLASLPATRRSKRLARIRERVTEAGKFRAERAAQVYYFTQKSPNNAYFFFLVSMDHFRGCVSTW